MDTHHIRQIPPTPDPEPPLPERILRATMRAGHWVSRRARLADRWIREQDLSLAPTSLIVALGITVGVGALVLLWLMLRLVHAVVTGLFGWVFGGNDEAAQKPAPEPSPTWLDGIRDIELWNNLYRSVAGYADVHATAAGMPPQLLLVAWLGLGAVLLLSGWAQSHRYVGIVAAWAWLAATCWVIWTNTPGGSPVPAALVAAAGVCISVAPWSVLPIGAVVAVSVFA